MLCRNHCVLRVVFRRILVNYTVATELEPDVFAASTNCQNSMLMHENYLLDRTLQDEFTELAQVRAEMVSYQQELEFADFVKDSTRYFQPPSLPPPPPPSPPPPRRRQRRRSQRCPSQRQRRRLAPA